MMRIQKYCSEQGICSRREAEDYIVRGLIKVNGKVVRELGTQIDPEKDTVELIQERRNARAENKITVLCNKPRGYVCSKIKDEGPTIFDLFPQFTFLNTVGRLDKDSEGLILLSNDGVITRAVTGDDHLVEKEYEVHVRENLTPAKLQKLASGVDLGEGIKTLPAKVKLVAPHIFRIILREGKKHQIRRMTSAVFLTIEKLRRVRIGNLTIQGLPQGAFRELSPREIQDFRSRGVK